MKQEKNTSNAVEHSNLCSHRTQTGRRCRIPAEPNSTLCFRHAALRNTDEDGADLSSHFEGLLTGFNSGAEIHDFLAKLVALVVENRIAARRASVLAYLTNQLLHSLALVRKEDDENTQVTFSWFNQVNKEPESAPPSHPVLTPPAEKTYSDLRT